MRHVYFFSTGNRHFAILLLVILAVLQACKDRDEVTPGAGRLKNNTAIYTILKEWYLWNDQVPQVNVSDYETPQELIDAVRNKTIDKWSYAQDAVSFDQFFKSGQFVGHGFGMKLDADRNLRVSFVYTDSPMGKAGVTRGYKITKINGQPVSALLASNTLQQALGEDKAGVQNRFELEDLTGQVSEITVAKAEVHMNTVLHREVKQMDGKNIGYLVFNTFIDKSKEELDEAFAFFQSQHISELVLDLRYNGGGSLTIAQHLADLIASSRAGTNTFVELMYNAQKQAENKPYYFSSNNLAINLNRLFVITSRSSASASEAVINGLRPYMPVYTIGNDSHGKPVGMNVWKIGGYAIVPVTFKVANAAGQAEYFDGIKADAYAADNVAADFGDVQEDCLQEALYYIQNGVFSGNLTTGRSRNLDASVQEIQLEGFRAEIGAF